jgi:hypothetical protein
MMPAAFSGAMNFAGLPAEVVTNLTPVADELEHRIVAQESNWQVDTERQVQRFHLVDLGLTGLGFARRGLDDAEATGA